MINFIKRFLFIKKNKLHEVFKILDKRRPIFDVGAHYGDKSIKLINYFSKIILVEPQPNCIAILKKKFSKCKNVTIIEAGLNFKEEILDLKINSSNPLISTFSDHWGDGRFKDSKWDKSLKIKTITLDQLINDHGHPCFIKIDVEGYEYNVIKGLTTKTGVISFEFTSEFFNHSINCLNYLENLGYSKFNYSEGERKKFRINWNNKNQVIESIKKEISDDPLFWGDIYCA